MVLTKPVVKELVCVCVCVRERARGRMINSLIGKRSCQHHYRFSHIPPVSLIC